MKLRQKIKQWKCYHYNKQIEGEFKDSFGTATYYYCPDCHLHFAVGPYIPNISGGF